MKKRFLISFLLCIFSSLVLKAQQKPNILILYADYLGYGDLSFYGTIAISTPHIDYLEQKGLRFTDTIGIFDKSLFTDLHFIKE